MTATLQSIEESLSFAHVGAIVSYAGATFNQVPKDFGVDASVRRIAKYNQGLMDAGVSFDCQLKATINWGDKGDNISYVCDSDTYNKIIQRNREASTPCILIILCLPKEKEDWLKVDDNGLLLTKKCYYYHLNDSTTSNTSSITLSIPKSNALTPDSVKNLINKIREGQLS